MSSPTLSTYNVSRLFKSEQNLDTTIKTGVRRVLKAFYHCTEMNQSKIQGSIANGLDHVRIVYDEKAKEHESVSGGARGSDSGLRALQRVNHEAKEKLDDEKSMYAKGSVEYIIIEGILHAFTNSLDVIGAFDVSGATETLEDLVQYYQSADTSENISHPSSDEEDSDEED